MSPHHRVVQNSRSLLDYVIHNMVDMYVSTIWAVSTKARIKTENEMAGKHIGLVTRYQKTVLFSNGTNVLTV